MACARQLFGLNLIPTPVFGVDSTPRMGEWVGGWDGVIWDDFSSWTCHFSVGDIDRPLSGWGYGPAPFPHLLSPSSASLMHFMATRCVYVYCETSTLRWIHGDTFSVSAAEHQFLPLVSSNLFCYLLCS